MEIIFARKMEETVETIKPVLGNQRWAILLCGVPGQDSTLTRRDRQDYVDLFVNNGANSMNQYWRAASNNTISLDGSQVFGWVDLPDSFSAIMNRTQRIIDAATYFSTLEDDEHAVDFRNFDGILVVTDADIDLTGVRLPQPIALNGETRSYRLVICSQNHIHAQIAHEMGHAFGLDHSFDTDPNSHDPNNDGRPGAYGDAWDIMSAMTSIRPHNRPPFGNAGALLNAVNMERLGWLQPSRVAAVQNNSSATLQLRPLHRPDLPGPLAAKVGAAYVEFRVDTPSNGRFNNWDEGLTRPAVLVHIAANSPSDFIENDTHPVLLSNALGVQDLQAGGVLDVGDSRWPYKDYTRIEVLSIDMDSLTATVSVSHRSARPEPVDPGIIQWILEGVIGVGPDGRIIKVPPRQPVRDILVGLAMHELAQQIENEEERLQTMKSSMNMIARIARREIGR
jgi:M6 family metalloprotease-like protein